MERFPGGESLDDLAERANSALDQILLPYVWNELNDGAQIAVVSHGLFLAELITTLVKRGSTRSMSSGKTASPRDFRGMQNTAWTKVQVTAEVRFALLFQYGTNDNWEKTAALKENTSMEERKLMPLTVQVMNINNSDHLLSLVRSWQSCQRQVLIVLQKRQRGGIGSSVYDSRQKDIRAFFKEGAGQGRDNEKKVEEVQSL